MISKLMKEVFQVLKNDSLLSTKVKSVNDGTPKNKKYPYIILSDLGHKKINTLTKKGYSVDLDIDVYSDYNGKKYLYEINEIVSTLMNEISFNDLDYFIKEEDVDFDELSKGCSSTLVFRIEVWQK